MENEDSLIRCGETPALMFVPYAMKPGDPIPQVKTLVVVNPVMYTYIRDMVINDQAMAIQQEQEAEGAVVQMMDGLLGHSSEVTDNSVEGERAIGPVSIRLEEHLKSVSKKE